MLLPDFRCQHGASIEDKCFECDAVNETTDKKMDFSDIKKDLYKAGLWIFILMLVVAVAYSVVQA